MRSISVVTTTRADYSAYSPVLRRIEDDPELKLELLVSGAHLSAEFGYTVDALEDDGFFIRDRIEILLSSDTPEGIGKSTGLGVIGFSQLFGRYRPDILVVLGDRFEMYAAALAALPFRLPIAHIHGGEVTHGAIDDALRHSLTKLSHLHFVSTDAYARRVIQLGEEPWRVTVSGAPSLDNLRGFKPLSREALYHRHAIRLDPDKQPFMITYHPVTLEYEETGSQIESLLGALAEFDVPMIFTKPNADTAGRIIIQRIEEFASACDNVQLVDSLGLKGYFSLMHSALAMVGNSSSGLIEAPSFHLPVVNIGTRQEGRLRGHNVIDVGYSKAEIIEGIRRALAPAFRKGLSDQPNPYGSGQAAELIVKRLKEVSLDERLLIKHFYDLPGVSNGD